MEIGRSTPAAISSDAAKAHFAGFLRSLQSLWALTIRRGCGLLISVAERCTDL